MLRDRLNSRIYNKLISFDSVRIAHDTEQIRAIFRTISASHACLIKLTKSYSRSASQRKLRGNVYLGCR